MTGCIAKAGHFFKVAILPELMGKFFSRPSTPASNTEEVSRSMSDSPIKDDANIGEVYCYCCKAESGQMIGCDNPSCNFEWFHFECLKITAQPKKKSWSVLTVENCQFSRNVKNSDFISYSYNCHSHQYYNNHRR